MDDEPTSIGACCALVPLPTISGRYPNKEEEYALIRLAKTGDERARNLLIECNIPFIKRIASRYRRNSKKWSVDDLLNEGIFGYVHAIHKFDFERNLRLTTYATAWVFQSINRFALNNGSIIRVPLYAHRWDSPDFKSDEETRAFAKAALQQPQALQQEGKYATDTFVPAAKEEEVPIEHYPDIEKVIAVVESIENDRLKLIFYSLLEGQNLTAISKVLNLSVERVRQLEVKLFAIILAKM